MASSVYMFDAYGTLFDVHAAVRQHADKVGPDHALVSDIWRQKQLEYTWMRTMIGRYEDFWGLTQQSLDYALARVPSANADARSDLLDAYWTLACFEEVPAVLGKLKEEGKTVGILSNGSPAMLFAAVRSAGLEQVMDHTISVDQIGRFKTVPEVYQLVLDTCGVKPQDVSFQSSNRWDIAGAKAFGFHTVWINRTQQPDEYFDLPPDEVLSDLRGLLP